MKRLRIVLLFLGLLIILGLAVWAGYYLGASGPAVQPPVHPPKMPATQTNVPVLTLSPQARKLAEIEVAPVQRKFVTVDVRLVGKVQYDEKRVGYVTAWVGGRLDRLYVDFTGERVLRGAPMVCLYSPTLISAQEELLQAIKAQQQLSQTNLPAMKETGQQTIKAARERLRLFGMTPEQIKQIEQRNKVVDQLTITAPMGGTVIHKNGFEGMYVKEGTRIYTIADLSLVWIMLDAYESDLTWLRYGQQVEFTTNAYPGKLFKGRIAFIDPFMNDRTRTVSIRVNVPNADRLLKPAMFVNGVIHVKMATGGEVVDPKLAGRWIGPKHPQTVLDGPGACPVCGRDLIPAEKLGFAGPDAQPPLVIPASAPLITGERAVVYVQIKEGTYRGCQIVLGPRAGNYFVVNKGLQEGQLVVVKGNFKIDSAMEIKAKPCMMNPKGRPGAPMKMPGMKMGGEEQ